MRRDLGKSLATTGKTIGRTLTWNRMFIYFAVLLVWGICGSHGQTIDQKQDAMGLWKQFQKPGGGMPWFSCFQHFLPGKSEPFRKTSLWPGAAVIYTIEPIDECTHSASCKLIMEAMDEIERRTCIRFKERSGEKDYVKISYDPKRRASEAYLGRVGGEQCMELGSKRLLLVEILHEFGHVLGLPDEVTRPDRDDYIELAFDKMRPEDLPAFEKEQPYFQSVMKEPFDYFSVMMYDPYSANKDAKVQTIFSKTSQQMVVQASKKNLSDGDIRKITALYQCYGASQDPSFPFDVSCSFEDDMCGFTNINEAFMFRVKTDTPAEKERKGFLYVDFEANNFTAARIASVSFHGLSPIDRTRGPMGCVSFSYRIASDGPAELRVSKIKLKLPHEMPVGLPSRTLFTKSEPGTDWERVDVQIQVNQPFVLVFRAQFKEGTTEGMIGLDDFTLTYTPCKPYAGPSTLRRNKSFSTLQMSRKSFKESKTFSKLKRLAGFGQLLEDNI